MCIFTPGPVAVPRLFFVSPICFYLSFPPLSAGPNALNFKFRATTVSTVAATTDFRVFPPAYALSFVSVAHPLSGPVIRNRHRDLRRGISGYPHTFIYGATLYVSELIL